MRCAETLLAEMAVVAMPMQLEYTKLDIDEPSANWTAFADYNTAHSKAACKWLRDNPLKWFGWIPEFQPRITGVPQAVRAGWQLRPPLLTTNHSSACIVLPSSSSSSSRLAAFRTHTLCAVCGAIGAADEGQILRFQLSLSKSPAGALTVTVSSDSPLCTVSSGSAQLQFTESNYEFGFLVEIALADTGEERPMGAQAFNCTILYASSGSDSIQSTVVAESTGCNPVCMRARVRAPSIAPLRKPPDLEPPTRTHARSGSLGMRQLEMRRRGNRRV